MKKLFRMATNQKAVPAEVKQAIAIGESRREYDLVRQIALMECGLLTYASEGEFCDTYDISRQQLEKLKVQKRQEIEDFKERHQHGKFKIIEEINGRLTLTEALRQAATRGDKESVRSEEHT